MRNREEEISGKEVMDVRQVSVDGDELWGGYIGVEGEERDGRDRREVYKLGVERRTPGYMIREEVQRDKMRGEKSLEV